MKNIYVDIDGTLTLETEGWGDRVYSKRTPNIPVIQYVNNLSLYEHITIYTSRHEEDRRVTERWLKKHGVVYHKIIFNKPQFDLLIDDKTLNPKVLMRVK